MSHVAQGKQQKKLFVLIQEATNLMSLVCALYSRQVVEVIAAHRGIADVGGFARTLYENTCRLANLVLCARYLEAPVVEKIELIVCKVKTYGAKNFRV